MAGFAIKDVMKLTLTPLTGGGTPITINYLNSCSLNWEEESSAAKKNGKDSIFIGSPKTGTFKIDAEVIEEDFLTLSMGGVKTKVGEVTTIEVAAVSPNTLYSIKGLFNVVEEGGVVKPKEVSIYSAKPKASGELTLNAEEFTPFSMEFDLSSNSSDKFITYKDYVAPVGAAAVKPSVAK